MTILNDQFGIPSASKVKEALFDINTGKVGEILKSVAEKINEKSKTSYEISLPDEEGMYQMLAVAKEHLKTLGYEVSYSYRKSSQDGPYFQPAGYILTVKIPGFTISYPENSWQEQR
jgi:hypothetical protein